MSSRKFASAIWTYLEEITAKLKVIFEEIATRRTRSTEPSREDISDTVFANSGRPIQVLPESNANTIINEGLPASKNGRRDEHRLAKEYQRNVRLKKGGQICLEAALIHLGALQILLDDMPNHFPTLLAIAREDQYKTDQESVSVLRYYGFLRQDDTIHPGLRDVLLSAYEEIPDGPLLSNPFTDVDTNEIERLNRLRKQDFVTEVRKRIKRNEEGLSLD
jgi:hypothetical protein